MVEVVETGFLNGLRNKRKSREFPSHEYDELESSVEAVPDQVFLDKRSGREIGGFDEAIADRLPEYEFEHAPEKGRNPSCKLWMDDGFDHSVDLYHPDGRIAVEIEKSQRKRVSDDILKFIKGGKTQRDNRKKIEFGCLIVPINYRGRGNLYNAAMDNLRFMRSILFVEDVAVIGYRDPRWE